MNREPRPMRPRRDPPVASSQQSRSAVLPLLLALLVAACGAATATPSPSPTAVPAGSPDGSPGSARPTPTSWPGGVIEVVMALGKADAEIKRAGADLGAAAAYEDLAAMRGAADGLTTLLERVIPLVDRIRDYPATASAAAAYDKALPVMLSGATKLRDAIDAGDAPAIAAASQELSQGLQAYSDAQDRIAPLVEQAILMQRLLVK